MLIKVLIIATLEIVASVRNPKEIKYEVLSSGTRYEKMCSVIADRDNISGKYRGVWQQRSFVMDFVTPISVVYTNYDPPHGRIEYAGKTFDFVCFKTTSENKYEVRLKRPNNPAILGEFLEWRAFIEPTQSDYLKLTVCSDLSSIEKLKYSLPSYGAVISLRSSSAKNRTHYSRTTTFCGNTSDSWSTYVFLPNGTCTLDFGVNLENIEGEWTRGHADGRYYIKGMVIYVTWEEGGQEEYRLTNNGTMFRDGDGLMKKVEE